VRRPATLLLLVAAVLAAGCAHRGTAPESVEPGAREKGLASWYGRPYHGRWTASGEVYDMYGLTAAHRTLPFGTRVEVTRRDDGRSVVVRINDRGPFVRHRIIDLSYGAAKRIGLDVDGVAPVTVRVLGPGEEGSRAARKRKKGAGSAPAGSAGSTSHGCFWVQVGAFRDHDRAAKVRKRLEEAGHHALIMEGPSGLERVRLGPFEDRPEAEAARRTVRGDWPSAAVVPCG